MKTLRNHFVLLFLILASTGVGMARADDASAKESSDPFVAARNRMVDRHLVERGIKDPRVLKAFRTVPRHLYVPSEYRRLAYEDESIPIGEGQTITPTYDVAFMTEVLEPKATDKVYEVGTGSGYQASILSRAGQGRLFGRDSQAAGRSARRSSSRSWGMTTFIPGLATAMPAGPTRRLSTRSS